ncbi:MAG: glycosyltransferase family 4 protein [Balneola sp.]|nr:MAG: glycosyltransferase family 4 protein [Balneola sp.]
MKLALISHTYPTIYNPKSGKFVQDQFELLSELDEFETDLFVPTPYSIIGTERHKKNQSPFLSPSTTKNRFTYLSFPRKKFPGIVSNSLSRKAAHVLSQTDYDIVHVHWLYPDGMMIPALKKMGFKIALTIHGSDWYQSYSVKQMRSLIQEVLLHTDKILFSGPKISDDVINAFPEVEEKSTIIYNMVDPEVYRPVSEVEKEENRSILNWESPKKHALTIANLRPEKGIDRLISSIYENEDLRDVIFHIIGNTENSSHSKEIENSISSNPFGNIELHKPVPPHELLNYYGASDFYILPSRREGFNVSILEATACGIPIVCSDVSGAKQVIELGTGLLSKNQAELTDAIIKMSQTFSNYSPEMLHHSVTSKFGKIPFRDRITRIYNAMM